MKKLTDLIQTIEDLDYRQTLYTIEFCLPEKDHEKFFEMLQKSEKEETKIYIDEDMLDGQWDGFGIEVIKN
ncbi:hypothetical protein [Chryseobacterium cucumeris]|uniref:hypothetical protein n=1 Tax=Chryseobacterium cucumeris TaxID=1813611 RepID=UPI0037BE6309